MTKSLLSFDTDRIKNYVFGTNKLKEIRGASALLDRLNREEMSRLVGGKEVYANGGGGLFVVEAKEVETAIQLVKQAYHQATHSASVTAVYVELPNGADDQVERHQMDLIGHLLRAKKDSPDKHILPLTHPLLYFCDSCGLYYAEIRDGAELLCRSCWAKRKENERVKDDIKEWTSRKLSPNLKSHRLWERLIGQLETQGYPISGYKRPETFEDLGKLSSPSNYMGLIYADGDGMGHEIKTIKDLNQFKQFAEAVDKSVYQCVQEAIGEHLHPKQKKLWPFDILLLGGDDLVMVTRAQSAIDVTLHIVERFPMLTKEYYGKSLTLSASVVLTHVNYPIASLLKLAESGLKFAKQQGAKRRLDGETFDGGLLNFLVVSSANHLDFGTYYKQVLKHKEDEAILYRTRRPYTTEEMRNLLDKIQRVSVVPRTKLEQLRTAIFKSRQQGTLDAIMATLRLRDAKQRQALFELVGQMAHQQVHMPWQQWGEDWTTPVLDVVELVDFVGR